MSIYTFLIKINTIDLQSYGFSPAVLEGNWDSPAQSFPEVNMPTREGTVRTTVDPVIEPLDFTVNGELGQSTQQNFEDYLDKFKYLVGSGDLTIIVGNQETRQRVGALKGPVHVAPYLADTRAAPIRFVVHCENPVAYATSATTVTGSVSTDLALAMGTRRTFGVVTVAFSGGASSTTLTYKNYAGTTVATIVITHAFVNTDSLVVDMANRRVTLNGVRHDEYVTSGDFFAFSPYDGDYLLSHWPTLRSSAGSLSIVYTKAYQ